MCDDCQCNECMLRRMNDRQRETINQLLGRIEILKAALRMSIEAFDAHAGEGIKDERIIAAQRALKGKA